MGSAQRRDPALLAELASPGARLPPRNVDQLGVSRAGESPISTK